MPENTEGYIEALNYLLDIEGPRTNHMWDPGGDTVFGIARNIWPQYWTNGPPTLDCAKRFYLNEFWEPLRLPEIDYQPLRVEIFEAAVNCGMGNAVRFAQRAYNLLRPREWTELLVDGQIGPRTLTWLNRTCARWPDALLAACNFFQADYYVGLRDEIREHAIRGWFAKRLLWQRQKQEG